MNSMYFIALIVSLQICQLVATNDCTSNNDCPFGRCPVGTGVRTCQCDLDCSAPYAEMRNQINHYGCTNRSSAIAFLCEELGNACANRVNYRIRRTTLETLAMVDNNCENIFAQEEITPDLEFCEDQSICHFNGICLRTLNSPKTTSCMCNSRYTGKRCEVLVEQSTFIHRIVTVSTRPLRAGNHETDGSMNAVISTVIPIGLIISVLACVCIISRYRKRKEIHRNTKVQIEIESTKRASNTDDIIIIKTISPSPKTERNSPFLKSEENVNEKKLQITL